MKTLLSQKIDYNRSCLWGSTVRIIINNPIFVLKPGSRVLQHAPVWADRVWRSDDGPGGRLSQCHGPLPHERHLLLQRDRWQLALLRAPKLQGQDVLDQAWRVQEIQRMGRQERPGWLHQTHHGLLDWPIPAFGSPWAVWRFGKSFMFGWWRQKNPFILNTIYHMQFNAKYPQNVLINETDGQGQRMIFRKIILGHFTSMIKTQSQFCSFFSLILMKMVYFTNVHNMD